MAEHFGIFRWFLGIFWLQVSLKESSFCRKSSEWTAWFSPFSSWKRPWIPWILPCCGMAPRYFKQALCWSWSLCWFPSLRPGPSSPSTWGPLVKSTTSRSKNGGSAEMPTVAMNGNWMRYAASGLVVFGGSSLFSPCIAWPSDKLVPATTRTSNPMISAISWRPLLACCGFQSLAS